VAEQPVRAACGVRAQPRTDIDREDDAAFGEPGRLLLGQGRASPLRSAFMRKFVAGVLLVDARGAVLLQERDEHASTFPDLWAFPAGVAEPGEQPLEVAHRELFEETGLRVDELELFWEGPMPASPMYGYLFHGRTRARQEDVVLGEGRSMVFVPADQVLDLDLAGYARPALTDFLASAAYRRHVAAAG
jgi:8-oxo-dGTP pyrophosphatase MutT (NUDIX family)